MNQKFTSFIKKTRLNVVGFFFKNVYNISEKPFNFVHIGLKVFLFKFDSFKLFI